MQGNTVYFGIASLILFLIGFIGVTLVNKII